MVWNKNWHYIPNWNSSFYYIFHVYRTNWRPILKLQQQQQQQQRPFNGLWSGTTRVGRYQKELSPTHSYPNQRASFIIFLHLQRSMASSLFSLRAWQSSRRPTTSFQVFWRQRILCKIFVAMSKDISGEICVYFGLDSVEHSFPIGEIALLTDIVKQTIISANLVCSFVYCVRSFLHLIFLPCKMLKSSSIYTASIMCIVDTVPSFDRSSGVRRVCCWAPCGQEIYRSTAGGGRPAAVAPQYEATAIGADFFFLPRAKDKLSLLSSLFSFLSPRFPSPSFISRPPIYS